MEQGYELFGGGVAVKIKFSGLSILGCVGNGVLNLSSVGLQVLGIGLEWSIRIAGGHDDVTAAGEGFPYAARGDSVWSDDGAGSAIDIGEATNNAVRNFPKNVTFTERGFECLPGGAFLWRAVDVKPGPWNAGSEEGEGVDWVVWRYVIAPHIGANDVSGA